MIPLVCTGNFKKRESVLLIAKKFPSWHPPVQESDFLFYNNSKEYYLVRTFFKSHQSTYFSLGRRRMKIVVTVLCMCLIIPFIAFSQSGWIWQNPRPTGNDLNAVKMIDTNTIVAVGAYGTILRTTNGGGTWTVQAPPARSALLGVDF
jgi:hypothetical protein